PNRFEKVDEDKYTEWQNYAGFLAALGGVCFTVSQGDELTNSQISSSGSSSFRSVATDSSSLVEKFTTEMVELLACDHLMAREWVREIIGNDLSPTLYPITFHSLEETMSQCFSSEDKNDPTCGPQYTLFVDQAVSALKLIMERLTESAENLFMVDFSNLISLCAFYVNKLPKDSGSMKMKIKLCQLIEVMILKKDNITLRQEFKLRNKLLEIIAEWTSDYSLAKKPYLQSQSSFNESSQLEKLQKDLDVTCIKTIVTLLHQLPLQPLETHQGSNATQSKSKIFFKYFTYFFKILNRCRVLELESSSQSHSSIEYRANSEMAPLKNFSVLALSNLLSANVDAGLKYSFSMGYHEDTSTRTAFMEVLANILNQGTEFETLSETVVTDRYEKLIDMVVYSGLNIGMSLCEVCPPSEIDDVSSVLLACYASRENEADLFRRTSIATRLLSAYTKEHGSEYVKAVLLPVFQKIYERSREDRCFEMDPTKLEQNEDFKKNRNNVIEITEMFLQAICNSVDLAPQSFREICNHIATSVRERFPEAKHTAVGSFIFLRFFCPAIVAPEADVLVKNSTSVPRDLRRGFLMATKVVQNLANNVLFGSKETYMIGLNDFLSTNIYRVASFLREISKLPDQPEEEEPQAEQHEMDEKNYTLLHHVLAENMENISKDISEKGLSYSHDRELLNKWKREFDRFANILAQLGRAPKISKKEPQAFKKNVYANSSQFYTDFMRRNSQRNIDSIVSNNIIFEGGVSKAGRRVVYLIMRHIEVDKIDLELLIYHMVQSIVNDVFHISEIEQIASIQHDSQGNNPLNEFSFKTTRDASVNTFNSPKREIIVNTIRQSKRRYESSRSTAITERTIRPKDVPGRLLNMSLLNLGSDDPSLRLSSYKLLYALSRAFNFDVGKQLLEAKDLCLPANSTDFIVYISQKIADKEPSLTLEFLNECVMGYSKSEDGGKYLTLLYMIPWLPNLSLYCGNSAIDTAKTKEILKQLIDLTINGE
ncbi:Ras GTPase activating protein ira2, partial [Rhizopus stolonifer]